MLGGRYPFDGKAMPLEERVTAWLRLLVMLRRWVTYLFDGEKLDTVYISITSHYFIDERVWKGLAV